MITRYAIIEEAKSWIGTPYHHMACCKKAGCDCATFLCGVYTAVSDIPMPTIEFYPEDWHCHQNEPRYLNKLLEYCNGIYGHAAAPLPGDIVMVRIGFARTHNHGAIILDWPIVIHCMKGPGVVMDDAKSFICGVHADPLLFRLKAFCPV